MDNVITRIEIDLYSPTSYEVIKAQQGDNNSRIIEFVITNQGECYTISDTCFAKFEGHRGDGSSFIKNAMIKDNIVTVVLDEDILYYAGAVEAKVVFYESDNILSPIPVKISVQKNPCDKNNLTDTDKSLINQLIRAQESHNSNKDIHISDEEKEKLKKAEENQNAFSSVKVDSTIISADSKTDTFELVAGDNIIIETDENDDKITISSSHPTISKSTDTTSAASPSTGGTFTTVDSIVKDANGHVTKVNTKTITLPSTSVIADSALSATSTNPVQNKVVNAALKEQAETSDYMKYLMSQANKTWVMPSSYSIELFDIGQPDKSKYPPISYVHQNMYYLDVETGEVYEPVESGTGHVWVLYENLKSISDSILSTVADCTASTNNNDIAGASALAELDETLNICIKSSNASDNKVSMIYWDESYGLVFVTPDKTVRYISKENIIQKGL